MEGSDGLGLVVHEEKVVVSSRDVARVFEKEQYNGLQDIKLSRHMEQVKA